MGRLLAAYQELSDPPPLVLIGPAGPFATEFPPGVTVLYDLPHAAVMAAWLRSTIGVVPSVFPDPCPTTAIEAMAAGVPVIATRVGGLPDIVADGETGRLVEVNDVTGLGAALVDLHNDPKSRLRMSNAGRERARLFMAKSVIDRLEEIYHDVTA